MCTETKHVTLHADIDMDIAAGGIDLNNPALDDEGVPNVNLEGEGVPIVEPAPTSVDNTMPSGDTGAGTGQTLSSDCSGHEDEVQSTSSSQTNVQTPYPDMIFDSWQEAKLHYNRYAKQVGFSIKASTSRQSATDKQTNVCLSATRVVRLESSYLYIGLSRLGQTLRCPGASPRYDWNHHICM